MGRAPCRPPDRCPEADRLDRFTELMAEGQSHGLLGVKLDMTGSWHDVLDLYKHMRSWFPLLVICDQQTGTIYDEHAFLLFLKDSNAE